MSVNILVIDDDRTFAFPASYARTVSQAIEALESNIEWEEIWLDYDLGPETIEPVIAHISTQGVKLGHQFVIHTMNPVGRERLHAALDWFGYQYLDVLPGPYLRDADG